ncbi:hypothetical protein ACFO6R_11670 [Eubacterium multiforme]|uniref:Uncharacterized protein n=1 Tax=Eubacterium multiforme TaxID=83339 RepID=A0ABT9UY90_9FIRM|nr:hypothetical protein [Eubacterium multiforme]MDQ0151281.1 hypothetical protein [Eubacterium multiforme]
MKIQIIKENKKDFLDLLLLADERKNMIGKYLERGIIYVGTGDGPTYIIPFYEKCGFIKSHRINKFFIDNYDNPIYECGRQLINMVFLKKRNIRLANI